MNLDPSAAVLCRACGVPISPILLPVSTRLCIASSREHLAMSVAPLLVACPGCKLVSEYRDTDFRLRAQTLDRNQYQADTPRAVRLARQCGVDECPFPITIHSTMNTGTSFAEMLRIADQWTFDISCRCTGKHYLKDCTEVSTYIFEGVGLPPEDARTITIDD